MNAPRIVIPKISDHGSEIVLLGLIAGGVVWLLGKVIEKGVAGWDVAACLLVLQGIISAIKERWTQRSVDRMGQQLGQSNPPSDGPSGSASDPLNTKVVNPPNDPANVQETKS